jgi:hypothetical protein
MSTGNAYAGYCGDDFWVPPLFFREGDGRRHRPDWENFADDRDAADDEQHRALLCSSCQAPITTPKERHQKQNKHLHTFFNPAGIVYEIGCFRKAPGCLAYGRPSSEFSWFSGYCWQIAYCRRCGQHLGWKFSGEDEFFGLIVKKLTEN